MSTFTPNYMNHFVCLCGDCPDLCCRGWSVHLTRQDYDVLAAEVAKNPQTNSDILRNIALNPGREHSQEGGRIVWNADGECPFLDSRRLCGLYGRLGAQAQPGVCAQYPRIYNKYDDRLELNGVLSCPEIVRLLLELDAPLVWNLLPEGAPPPRLPPRTLVSEWERALWSSYAQQVRDTLCQLITRNAYPLSTRLVFCAFFAQHTLPAFTKGGEVSTAHRILTKAMQQIGDAEFLELLHQKITSAPHSLAMGVEAIRGIAHHGRPEVANSPAPFHRLMHRCLDGYGSTDAHVLYNTCLARSRGLNPMSRQWVDQAFDRFAHHFLLQESFLNYLDLMAYVRRLAIAVMVCRFLYYGLVGDESVAGSAEERLIHSRKIMIDVFRGYAKAAGHYSFEFSELDSLPKLLTFVRLW